MDSTEIYRLIVEAGDGGGEISLRRKNKVAKVSAILDAANALFAERGYESTTMDDIAGGASVARGTLYKYFATKETVLVALFVRGQKEIAACRARFLRECGIDRPIETMVAYERVLNRTGSKLFSVDLWRLIYTARMSDRTGLPGAVLSEIADSIVSDRVELLTRMKSAGSLAPAAEIASLARILHAIGRLHWEEYISEPEAGLAAANRRNAADVRILLKPYVSEDR
jgi:AcrR family transcriptional regulator